MASKNSPRNWNDVQTAIATVAIVTTLGMWNLFAAPAPKKAAAPPATQPPLEELPQTTFTSSTPTALPQVKIFFNAQNMPQSVVTPQPQQQQTTTRKKKNKNNNSSGGGGTVTTTRTS
jgi:hypothetical protein